MGVCGGSLTLMRKSTEDASTPAGTRLSLYGLVDCILAEAAQCVMPKVGGRRLVTFVLITPNASSLSLAFLGGTGKEVGDTALMYSISTMTSGLKNAYIGDLQVFLAAAVS